MDTFKLTNFVLFLSTLSLRRATSSKTHDRHKTTISIHALLAESDNILCVVSIQIGGFLSTLSLRRATGGYGCAYLYLIISIHALLAESDQYST